jgi:cytochrome c oxidase subunit 2
VPVMPMWNIAANLFPDITSINLAAVIWLHDYVMFYLIIILVFVILMYINILTFFWFRQYDISDVVYLNKLRYYTFAFRNFSKHHNLEIIWTVIPTFVLFLIAIPSFVFLYVLNKVKYPEIDIRIVGHQWYWSYELTDQEIEHEDGEMYISGDALDIDVESNMLNEADVLNILGTSETNQNTQYNRLLTTDNPLIFPMEKMVRIVVTSTDVLHSWAVPSLGMKIDAVPGRINTGFIWALPNKTLQNINGNVPITLYGQCSELCGVNHGFMPIEVILLPNESEAYFNFIETLSRLEAKIK